MNCWPRGAWRPAPRQRAARVAACAARGGAATLEGRAGCGEPAAARGPAAGGGSAMILDEATGASRAGPAARRRRRGRPGRAGAGSGGGRGGTTGAAVPAVAPGGDRAAAGPQVRHAARRLGGAAPRPRAPALRTAAGRAGGHRGAARPSPDRGGTQHRRHAGAAGSRGGAQPAAAARPGRGGALAAVEEVAGPARRGAGRGAGSRPAGAVGRCDHGRRAGIGLGRCLGLPAPTEGLPAGAWRAARRSCCARIGGCRCATCATP